MSRLYVLIFQVVAFRLIHRLAVNDTYLPLLACLLEHDCSMNSVMACFELTPILIAIKHGQVAMVKYLIARGAQVNMGNGSVSRITPLKLALESNQRDIGNLLLAAKDINVNDIDPEPVLMCSLRSFPEFVELLLEAGADPNITGGDGRTPLTFACATNTAMVKLLIQHGANVNKKNGRGDPPLAISVRLGKYMLPLSWYSVKYMLLKLVYSHILHAAIADISKNFLTSFL